MRLALGFLAGGLALVAGTAVAKAIDLPPPPTVPTPTVPTVTVPLPPPPKLPPPPPPPPLPKPPAPVSTVTNQTQTTASSVTQTATSSAGGVTGSTSSGSVAGVSSGSAAGAAGGPGYSASGAAPGAPASSSGSRSSSGMRVDRFRSSRGWIATGGPKRRRTTTLSFVLPRSGRVILTVNQVSPQCVGFGHFTVKGRAGLNRVRFAGRVQGRKLVPGTYRISIRTPSGQVVRRITLVVIDGSAPSSEELQAMRAANTCPAPAEQASLISPGAALSTPAPPASGQLPAAGGLGIAAPTVPNVHSGVLGSSAEETVRAIRPLLVGLLALSILLLSVASLPRYAVADPRVHDLLARHRIEIAGLGAASLIAVAIAFFIV